MLKEDNESSLTQEQISLDLSIFLLYSNLNIQQNLENSSKL